MAETACTKKLWEVVMGNNPSGFKGKQLLVETINWEECQEFIRKLNSLILGFDVRLQRLRQEKRVRCGEVFGVWEMCGFRGFVEVY
jgi:hypothetical protein